MVLGTRWLVLSIVAAGMAAGCSNKGAVMEAKRESDREAMRLEDLTNQRDAFKGELDRLRKSAGQMQKDLAVAKQQIEQDSATLARTNADLVAARAQLAQLDGQKTELALMKAELAASRAKMQQLAAPAAVEERSLASPATQPAINK